MLLVTKNKSFKCQSLNTVNISKKSVRNIRKKIPTHYFGQLFNHVLLYENSAGITRPLCFFNFNLKIYKLPCNRSHLNANGKIRSMSVQSIEFKNKEKCHENWPAS